MELSYVVFMTVVLSRCNCNDVLMSCPGDINNFDFECVGRRRTSDCNSEPKNFTWINLNQDNGKVTLQFSAFDRLCEGEYSFILEALENRTEDECKEIVFGQSCARREDCHVKAMYHSERNRKIVKDQWNKTYPHCEKTLNVTFNMIYRGCYRLKIREKRSYGNGIQTFCSSPVFLNTTFTKENIFKDNLTISSVYNSKHDHMEHTVSGVDGMHVSLMELTAGLCKPEETCDSCTTTNEHGVWLMGLNLAGEFKCRKGNNPSNCSLIRKDMVKCITGNIDNRPQCLWVRLYYHPCSGEGVWGNTTISNFNPSCQWYSPHATINSVIEKPAVEEGGHSVVIVFASVFSSLATLCLCIILVILRKKIGRCLHYASLQQQQQEYPLLPVLPEILLLYSRDCEPFMELMVTFRNMLQEVLKCKVYDCFDHALVEEVATGAVEWLNRHLKCDNMKIVVVESECAMLRQKALFQGTRICYQNPTWLDDIFIHGLKELANDKSSNHYNRFFVVCVCGFTDENDMLSIITPNTRYVIPQHIKELMTSLYGQPSIEDTEHLNALARDIQTLVEYKVNNVDYMNQLLIRAC